ncbi:hypothetical protein BH09VER1_BH09VER1_43600 [soil metagenome]
MAKLLLKALRFLLIFSLLVLVLLVVGREVWVRVETAHIMRQRDLTLQVFGDASNIAQTVSANDENLARDGKPSIWPADLGMKSAMEYLKYLQKQGYLDQAYQAPTGSLLIGNLSRNSPDHTIFVMSTGTMRDIHTFISSAGGVPNYATGFVAFRKDGKGQFYSDKERENHVRIGVQPSGDPEYLPN